MALLDKSSILHAMALKTETVQLDGGEVIVSEVGASDYLRLWTDPANQDSDGSVDMSKFTPALLAYAVVDAQGNRIFTTENDIAMLAKSAQAPFMKLAQTAKRLNGLGCDEIKNSEETAPEDSSSGSVSTSESGTQTT